MSTAQAQEQPEAAHTVHDAAAADAGAEVPSEAIPVDCRAGGVLRISQPHRDASKDLVPEPSRQGEALTRSGNREAQDGRQTDAVAGDVGTSVSARVVRGGRHRAWTIAWTEPVAAAVCHVPALVGVTWHRLPATLNHVIRSASSTRRTKIRAAQSASSTRHSKSRDARSVVAILAGDAPEER